MEMVLQPVHYGALSFRDTAWVKVHAFLNEQFIQIRLEGHQEMGKIVSADFDNASYGFEIWAGSIDIRRRDFYGRWYILGPVL